MSKITKLLGDVHEATHTVRAGVHDSHYSYVVGTAYQKPNGDIQLKVETLPINWDGTLFLKKTAEAKLR